MAPPPHAIEGYLEFINPTEHPGLVGTPVPTSPAVPAGASTAANPNSPTWTLLAGMAVATIFIAIVGALVRYWGGYA